MCYGWLTLIIYSGGCFYFRGCVTCQPDGQIFALGLSYLDTIQTTRHHVLNCFSALSLILWLFASGWLDIM